MYSDTRVLPLAFSMTGCVFAIQLLLHVWCSVSVACLVTRNVKEEKRAEKSCAAICWKNSDI